MSAGRLSWYFPDAELPPAGDGELAGHESVIVLNTNAEAARVKGTLWYVDREPLTFEFEVRPARVRCLRTNNVADMGGIVVAPEEQYAIGLVSDVPIVAQYGRLDVRQANMAFYTAVGYSE